MNIFDKEWLTTMLKQHHMEITFTKINGEQRVMPCTLKADMLPQVVKESTRTKEPNPNTLAVYVTDINQWRSFRVDSVTAVKMI
jgi:hypothetical protein